MFGNDADAYELYMGRWSRLVAPRFLEWLAIPTSQKWLDVGCGTGTLTQAIIDLGNPESVHGIDTSSGFVDRARQFTADDRATFEAFDAGALPVESDQFDAVVSGLVLNFLPDVDLGLAEMVRAVKPDGTVAAYVWDYAGKMEVMRSFWDVALKLDPAAAAFDEGQKEPMLCQPEPLSDHFSHAGLVNVEVQSIDVGAHFENFDDYWLPFTGNQGSAPKYLATLDDKSRSALKQQLSAALPVSEDGSIELIARSWAVSGKRPIR
jgi:ubiquinone/menaquinone biosynthesis C-methylase UbiE